MRSVLCAIPSVTGGGAERFYLDFLRGLDRTRFSAMALISHPGGFEGEIPADVPVRVLSTPPARAPRTGALRSVLVFPALVRALRRVRPDAILTFGSLFNGTVILAARAIGFAGPVVAIEAINPSLELRQYNSIARYARSIYLRQTYAQASAVVAVSDGVAADLSQRHKLDRNIRVIKCGVDLKKIHLLSGEPVPSETLAATTDDRCTIVAVGRLVPQKGFAFLIRAMALLPDEVRLVLVGDGPLGVELKRLAEHEGVTDRITFAGYDRNPYRYIARAGAFVLPSLWEGLGIVVIEALALGIPVVASDCPSGPRELLADGDAGILVPPGDARALADGIRRLLDDEALRASFAARGRDRAEMFSLGRCIRSYEDLLGELGGWSG